MNLLLGTDIYSITVLLVYSPDIFLTSYKVSSYRHVIWLYLRYLFTMKNAISTVRPSKYVVFIYKMVSQIDVNSNITE